MSALAQILQQEIVLVDRFLALLQQEQLALRDIQPDALNTVVADKLHLVEQMNQLVNERARLTGAPQDTAAMSTWLAARAHEKAAAQLWPQLIERAREAKRMHALNGQLINIHLNQTSEALKALGQQQTMHTTLYGANGQTFGSSGSRIVDAA
ncbi:MAG: flagellar protein FlgN [Dechloromonas sp.]|nr:flagellar protein FlgN [Dechloromonas sp.]